MTREERIEAMIASCEHCGSYEFPKESTCDGCINAVDEQIAEEQAAAALAQAAAEVERLRAAMRETLEICDRHGTWTADQLWQAICDIQKVARAALGAQP